MDTGPQKESDATGISKTKKKERERGRKKESKRKKAFQGQTRETGGK